MDKKTLIDKLDPNKVKCTKCKRYVIKENLMKDRSGYIVCNEIDWIECYKTMMKRTNRQRKDRDYFEMIESTITSILNISKSNPISIRDMIHYGTI